MQNMQSPHDALDVRPKKSAKAKNDAPLWLVYLIGILVFAVVAVELYYGFLLTDMAIKVVSEIPLKEIALEAWEKGKSFISTHMGNNNG